MKNFLSKSPLEDLQKIQFDIQLVLTEQRAQRVDLARVIQLVRVMIQKSDSETGPNSYNEYPEEEHVVDTSSSTTTGSIRATSKLPATAVAPWLSKTCLIRLTGRRPRPEERRRKPGNYNTTNCNN